MKFVFFCIMLAAGCTTKNITIDSTQPWEGHFYTVDEFRQKTHNMTLEKNQSVWVLSSRTLARVLKNLKESQLK